MALFIYSVTIVILCLTMEVHSEMSGDLVYSLLSDQIKNVAIKIYAIENEQSSINQRLDSLESQLLLPSNTEIVETTAKDNIQIPKKKEDRILKALTAEKTLVRNMLNSYEGELIAFQNTVGNQITLINKTLRTNNENMEREHEESTRALKNRITLLKDKVEKSTVKLERKFAKRARVINNSINELKSESERKLRDTIKMLETALDTTTTEHVGDYDDFYPLPEMMAENPFMEVESVEWQPKPTVSSTTTTTKAATTTTSIDTKRGTIKVGDRVRIKSSVDQPSHGWGSVTHASVGTVIDKYPDGETILIDFPEQSNWSGVIDEMEHV